MGILLLLILMGILIVFIVSLGDIIKKLRSGQFNYKSVFLSPFVSGALYLGLILYWKGMGRVYIFEPFFLIPFCCVGLPFLISQWVENNQADQDGLIADLMKCSSIVSVIMLVVFNQLLINIDHMLGVQLYH